MGELRFDGRVAIVTGAGRGIGRAHARLLTARGAKVVVNDLGGERAGGGASSEPAQQVVDEIVATGGEAIANTADVSTPEGAHSAVGDAIERFGRIDIVVNNAGIIATGPFVSTTLAELERLWRVNVCGHFLVTQAAWPHMTERGYGRVVMTGSGIAMYGMSTVSAYAAAKGAVFGLTRALACEGRPLGILVNVVTPIGQSRIGQGPQFDTLPAELISPAVALLAHERCPVSGEVYDVAGGRVSNLFLGSTRGCYDPHLTVDSLAGNWDQVMDRSSYTVPVDALDTMAITLRRQQDSVG